MDKPELKQCPCCGGNAKLCKKISCFDLFAVICNECGLKTRDLPTVEAATEAWNMRQGE